ncbi:MAG TPA: phosphocholine cytidylyltransferase family protein [Acetobacteraceae bacterium]
MTLPSLHALILAAGVGRRLNGSAGLRPKALLPFGGKTLLARHFAALRACDVEDITVVAGFEAAQIESAIGGDPRVQLVLNPDYREGSLVSLWAARDMLRAGRPVVLMDADVLCDARLLGRLVSSAHPNALLLDRDLEPGDEPVKLCVRDGRIVDFHKRPRAPHDWHGESVGFFRFAPDAAADLAARTEDYVANGRRALEYEEPIRDMMQAAPPGLFGFEDITGLPWTEIDFPEDVAKASGLLPQLVA